MSDQNSYEKIEAYLNGELTGAERSDFEQQLQTDKALAQQVLLFEEMDTALKDRSATNFQRLVEEQGNVYLNKPKEEEEDKPIIRKINWQRYISIAAIFTLLISALFIWKNQLNADLSNDELFTKHFETYNLNESLRGDESADEKFNRAIQKYQSQAYEESSNILQELVAENSANTIFSFSLGQSCLNQKPANLNLAKTQFKKIIAEGNSIYVPAAKWYLALANMKLKGLFIGIR